MRLRDVVAGVASLGVLASAAGRLAVVLAGAAAGTGCESCTVDPIRPEALPDGQVGYAYFVQIRADNRGDCGSGGVEFTLADGRLPPAMKLSRDGAIDGTPTQSGVYRFTVVATFESARDDGIYPVDSSPRTYELTIAP